MEFFTHSLFCKVRSVFAYLFSLFLWALKFPSSMQIPPHQWRLKTLIPPIRNPNYTLLKQPPLPPNKPALSVPFSMDDLIGTENGVCMRSKEEGTVKMNDKQRTMKVCVIGKNNRRREYPPAIPLLAQTGNLHGRMPWVLTRYYVNGRLILREVRVKHHEYFQAQRGNGRLVLNLVPMDDVIAYIHQENEETEPEEEEEYFAESEEEVEEEEVSESCSSMDRGIVSGWSSLCRIHSNGEEEEEENIHYCQPLSSSVPPFTTVSVM